MQALIAVQDDIHNRMTKARINYKKSPKERVTEKYVEVRLQTLEELWMEFVLGHKQIMENHHAEIGATTYVITDVYDVTQELYVDYKAELMTAAQTFVETNTQEHYMTGSACSVPVVRNNVVKLPKIVIPVFSGKYTEWTTFRDLFESLIHNNESIDKVQKMHYLKGYLTGEAEQLLRQIPISNSNYDKCWECLKQRYNNKRFMCQMILKRFLSQKNGTCESANFLKELIDTSTDSLHALKNLGIDVSTWDVIVIHLLSLKLDPETRKQWELTASWKNTEDVLPTFDQFKDFITTRFRALEFLETNNTFNSNTTTVTHKAHALHVAQSNQCPLCSESHKIIFCKEFAKLDIDSRRGFVQTNGLCFNCLGGFHSAKACQNPTSCKICKRRHHSLLHPKSGSIADVSSVKVVEATSNVGTVTEDSEGIDKCSKRINITSCFSSGDKGQVLLATAVVGAQSKNEDYYPVRALLDQGSQTSFVTEDVVQHLGLKIKPIIGNITGLGGNNNVQSTSMVTLNLQSLIFPEVKLSVKAIVLKSITTRMPAKTVVVLNSLDIQGLPLADPNYHTPKKIDILLGAEVYSQVILEGLKKNQHGTLVAQATSLGWIISGVVKSAQELSNAVVLHTNLAPFHVEDPRRKYGQSRIWPENRLDKVINEKTEFEFQDQRVVKEYLPLEHMEKKPEKEKREKETVYLPQHAVENIKQDRVLIKSRVIWNSSCKRKIHCS